MASITRSAPKVQPSRARAADTANRTDSPPLTVTAHATDLVVPRPRLVAEEKPEPDRVGAVGETTRLVEVRRIVRDALLIDPVELRDHDAVVVDEHLDERGVLHRTLIERRREHRTA